MGKLPGKELEALLSCVKKSAQVIIPPMIGYDSGVHLLDGKCIVVSTDPCIGVPTEWFGWLLIHYAASDVAVFGAQPQYAAVNLLAPHETKRASFEKVMKQACKAADELNMTIITGHTGTYDELSTLIGTCTAYGSIRRSELITPAGAKPGDHLICTKSLGLETLVNFSLTHTKLADGLFGPKETAALKKKVKMQTCVNEALALARIGGVTAMHDATEGGLVAALNEIADASNVGFSIDFAKLPISLQMKKLADCFNLTREQILAISSTGTLLAAVSPNHVERAIVILSENGLDAKKVGLFSKSKERLLRLDGKETRFPVKAEDPYAEIMA